MWRRRFERLRIGISPREARWRGARGTAVTVPLGSGQAPWSAVVESVVAALGFWPARTHVVVGSGVARHWLQAPPQGVRSLAQLRDYAAFRAAQLFADGAPWLIAADWQAARPFLCAAVPAALAGPGGAAPRLATTLCRVLARHAARLPRSGWFAVHEPEVLHVVHVERGEIDHLHAVAVDAGLDAAAVEPLARREIALAAPLAGLPDGLSAALPVFAVAGATQAEAALGCLVGAAE